MADNGNLFAGFTKDFVQKMAKLCSKANVIVPTMTEACFLLGIEYKASGYNMEYIKNLLKELPKLGAVKIVLKGVEFGDGKIGIAAYDSISDSYSCYFHKKMSRSFHGTGDIFASVLSRALMRGLSLEASYKLAADFVVSSIEKTIEEKD